MGDPRPLASLVEEIHEQGGTLDAHSRLNRNRGAKHLGWAHVAAALVAGATSDLDSSFDNLTVATLTDPFSYPALAISATALASVTYGAARWSERRQVRAAEERQEAVREILGEPVDVLRGNRDEKTMPVIRWYGLDRLPPGTPVEFVAGRLQRFLEVTKGTGLDDFAIGTGILATLVDIDSGQFGHLVQQRDFTAKALADVVDVGADGALLATSRWHCHKLLTELKRQVGSNTIERLTAIIQAGDRQTRIHTAVAKVDLTTEAGLKELVGAVEREIVADNSQDQEMVSYRDRQGVERRAWAQVSAKIVGDKIQTSTSYQDMDGQRHQSLSGERPLLKGTRYATVDALVDGLTEGASTSSNRARRTAAAKVALLLVTRRLRTMSAAQEPEEPRPGAAAARISPVVAAPPVRTLFQRVTAEPPRTIPRLRRHGAVRKGATPTVEYHRRGGARAQRIRDGLAVPTILFLSYFTGMCATVGEDVATEKYEERYQQAISRHEIYPSTTLEDYISAEAGSGAKLFLGGMDKLGAVRDVLDDVALRGVEKAGVSEETIAAIQRWIDSHATEPPAPPPEPAGSVYADENGNVGVGDVDTSRNEVVFRVSGSEGVSTAGFWYTNVNNFVRVSTKKEPTFPYKNVGITFTSFNSAAREIDPLPSTPPAEKDTPLYEVTGKLRPGKTQNVNLPIKSGTAIVAMRITGTGSTKVVVPTVRQDIETGTYRASIDASDVAGIDNPTIRYWLGKDPSNVVRARGPMAAQGDPMYLLEPGSEMPTPNYQPLTRVMGAEGRARVVASLGLAADATEREILAALRGKDYSFTPVKDGKGKPMLSVDPNDLHSAEVFATVGGSMGKLSNGSCNTTETVLMFSTGGRFEGEDLNVAVGFNDDGDGKLSSLEAHTLAVSKTGREVDPTPASFRGVASERAAVNEDLREALSVLAWGNVGLVGAVTAASLWRRRRHARGFAGQLVVKAADERFKFLADDGGKKTTALREAITVLEVIRYNPEGLIPPEPTVHYRRPTLDRLETEAMSGPVPMDVIEAKLAQPGVEVSRGIRRALRRLSGPTVLDRVAQTVTGKPMPERPYVEGAVKHLKKPAKGG